MSRATNNGLRGGEAFWRDAFRESVSMHLSALCVMPAQLGST